MANLLEIKNITKVFPGVKALDDVSFTARGGRVTGLIGVNGAGKSTLMNIIGGVNPATSGQIVLNGKELQLSVPQDAEKAGIGFIHQEPVMFNFMTVAENICLSRVKGTVSYKRMNAVAKKYLEMMGCNINPKANVGDLPIGDRQMVEIARALSSGGNVLLFDEPTASFSDKEKSRLFEVIRSLKESGAIIFFISHFLDEVQEITDDLVVLRDGKVVITGETKNITRAQILNNMIGGEIQKLEDRSGAQAGEVVFKVEELTAGKAPNHVSMEVKAGEIVGIWGLMGSGRTELLRTIYGLNKADHGKVFIRKDGELRHIKFENIRDYCGYVTEARHDDGVFLPWSVWENIASPNLKMFLKKGAPFLDYKKQREAANEYVKKLNIKTPSVFVKIESLSGGNQQKAIMAKWLMRKPRIFLLDEPTRGVDVGAKAEIHKMIQGLAKDGSAIVIISSEIEEISNLSDRVLVLNRGKIVAEVSKSEIDKETLMSYCV
jgi:ABC-type sugar transport system ATPase subunit